MDALTIEIYSDLICPWCYIGRRRLGEALKRLTLSEPPNLVWRPFELNPDLPKSGLDRRAYRTAKFGSWERSQAMDREVAETGKALGLAFHYGRVLVTPNTLDGHRLLWWARETSSPDALAEALFRAYFSEGRDLGKPEVLAEVAAEVGLSREQARRFLQSDRGREEVLAEEREARRRGLNDVPFFILNGMPAFAGAQPPGTFIEAFREVLGTEATACGLEGSGRRPRPCRLPERRRGDAVEALRRWEPAQRDYGEQLRAHGQRLGNRSPFN